MRRNPLKDSILAEYSFGPVTVTRRMIHGRAEELATVRGDWLHMVSASDFEAARRPTMKATAKDK